ncbi:hypothetical protein [Verminephrobacter aporrectodeae]|uniref:hypothetical protein n=1 Tax=Verminephrobacter aporrectodeae TaxID=1110389 RepID=UPI0022446853|nr:hypothetical protein [Verminephrobacter aporrectodeae]
MITHPEWVHGIQAILWLLNLFRVSPGDKLQAINRFIFVSNATDRNSLAAGDDCRSHASALGARHIQPDTNGVN